MPNRLATATSPYLLQHAGNPIDWWEWSDEAFAEAARRDVPVLLSVGYAACHWCHVMAHESFEDAATAQQVNEEFVAIKVDREERPDIDAVYMAATQAMTGQGGWPMTCFLTPAGEPFHCGTYYPPTARHGLPGFRQLLDAITKAWRTDGARVRGAAGQIAANLADNAGALLPPTPVDEAATDAAVATLAGEFDAVAGGFGGAPKFPPSMTCEFLLRHHERTGSEPALAMASATMAAMARGGMYDQLAGGFARYSVDAGWVVPHFEKMLYDNALLLRAYAHWARRTGDPLAARVADETAAFLLTDLRTPEGGFASALDADTDGVEGLTYAWTPAELRRGARRRRRRLGRRPARGDRRPARSSTAPRHCSCPSIPTIRPAGHGCGPRCSRRARSARSPRATTRSSPRGTGWPCWRWPRAAPRWSGRSGSPPPSRRRSCCCGCTSWTGGCDGRRAPASVGAAAGVLDDHACLADALLALHQATGERRWLAAATDLLDVTVAHFADPEVPGGFFDTADDAEALLHRPREITDNATPCGSSALASALLTASVLVQDGGHHRDRAEAALRGAGALLGKHARFAGHWLTAAEALLRGPLQIAVVGDGPELVTAARRAAPGGSVVVAGSPEEPGVPLLAGRPLLDGAPAAYVCRGFVCDRPVATAAEIEEALVRLR